MASSTCPSRELRCLVHRVVLVALHAADVAAQVVADHVVLVAFHAAAVAAQVADD